MEHFGKELKRLRKENHMTQEKLSELIGVSNRTISKWESGNSSRPDLETTKKICEVFKVDINDIFYENTKSKRKALKCCKCFLNICKFVRKHLVVILETIALIFFGLYFFSNFRAEKYYVIKNDEIGSIPVNGYFIESKGTNIIFINEINFLNKIDYEYVDLRVKLYVINNGDKNYIYESDNLNSIFIEELYGYDEIFTKKVIEGIKKGLYLEIDIVDIKNKIHHYETKFDVIESFVNDKLIYFKKDRIDNSADDSIKFEFNAASLIENGFEKDGESNVYVKNDKNISIWVDFDMMSVTICKNTKRITATYSLLYKAHYLKVKIKDGNDKVKSFYEYNYSEDNLICKDGDCENYLDDFDYVLKEIETLKK